MSSSFLVGTWTYRSFHNTPTPVAGDPNRAIALLFAEAEFRFEAISPTTFRGVLDWSSGGLDLTGMAKDGPADMPVSFSITGLGRTGTQTDGWEYDYNGALAHQWADGIAQLTAMIGSVLRAKPRNGASAGYTASFVAVQKA
jgi:hypothetical protein